MYAYQVPSNDIIMVETGDVIGIIGLIGLYPSDFHASVTVTDSGVGSSEIRYVNYWPFTPYLTVGSVIETVGVDVSETSLAAHIGDIAGK